MTPTTYESLCAILDHFMPDEKDHWEASGYPDNHIYQHLQRVEKWAQSVKGDYQTNN